MAAGSSEADDALITDINVTPLVDVVLVLLIIFMVTATYIVRRAIQVDVPRASAAGESVATAVVVAMTRDGALYLDGQRRSESEIELRLRQVVARDRDARALVSADQALQLGSVVRVIDLVKRAGVGQFALDVRKEEGENRISAP
jgi:biopolymer transport protein ExbD